MKCKKIKEEKQWKQCQINVCHKKGNFILKLLQQEQKYNQINSFVFSLSNPQNSIYIFLSVCLSIPPPPKLGHLLVAGLLASPDINVQTCSFFLSKKLSLILSKN
jgi:hypothetical protein